MERFKYRVDENHRAIVAAFDEMEFSIVNSAKVGGGVPDLFVAKFGKTIAVEIKAENGSLNEEQVKFMETWQGRYLVVRTVGHVIALEDELREEVEDG